MPLSFYLVNSRCLIRLRSSVLDVIEVSDDEESSDELCVSEVVVVSVVNQKSSSPERELSENSLSSSSKAGSYTSSPDIEVSSARISEISSEVWLVGQSTSVQLADSDQRREDRSFVLRKSTYVHIFQCVFASPTSNTKTIIEKIDRKRYFITLPRKCMSKYIENKNLQKYIDYWSTINIIFSSSTIYKQK